MRDDTEVSNLRLPEQFEKLALPFKEEGSVSSGTGVPRQSPRVSGASCQGSSLKEESEALHKLQRTVTKKSRSSVWKTISLSIVDSPVWVGFTTLLTAYALVGDDVRLYATEQPADTYFNAITILCIVVFSVDVVLGVLGKDDYFLSFFFWLDAISTSSLVLDLTSVSNAIASNSEDDVDDLSGSKTARIGARLVRVVRVLRLIRIFKLYKTIQHYLTMADKEKNKQRPGEDDDWDDVDIEENKESKKESRVGKKLSELTTRRVILLVLTMMLGLPFLLLDDSEQLPFSSAYGVDIVSERFLAYERNNSLDNEKKYNMAMLRYIYYHNWFRYSCPDRTCSDDYRSHVFWIGFVAETDETASGLAESATLNEDQILLFEEEFVVNNDRLWEYQAMPERVKEIMASPWTQYCKITTGSQNPRQGMSLLQDEIDGHVDRAIPCPEDLRPVEYSKAAPVMMTKAQQSHHHLAFYFDLRSFTQNQAMLSLFMTAFVCILLTLFSVQFSQDAHTLVLRPVENMIAKVEQIRTNPLMAMKMADEEFKREEARKAKEKRQKKELKTVMKNVLTCSSSGKTEVMETVILEKTIIKLGSLLALGFGEAGANIIEQNMHGVDSASVDAMVMGKRVECIVGNARIRNFSSATEVLQAKVMTFVNQIAEIVHGVVDEFHGAANKNNGDTFLVIWRTSDFDEKKVSKMADMSMLAFTRILGAVHRSAVLEVYRYHPGLQQRLGRLGAKFRVDISFGLHYGWSIEGAVGSEFKIDASYLSPNVSIAETVERATQIYGVRLLVAESVVSLCSPEMAANCRLIDCVIITGSAKPMDLYVIDLDYMALTVENPSNNSFVWSSRQRFRARQFLELEKKQKFSDDVQVVTLFNRNQDVMLMRVLYTVEFLNIFNMGYQNYAQGEWEVAHRLLAKTQTMLGQIDGPSTALLRFMEEKGYEAPPHWHGIREIGNVVLN